MNILALSSGLESFRLVEPLNRARATGPARIEVWWEHELGGHQRDRVRGYVPGSHTLSPADIAALKSSYPNLSFLSAPMTGINGIDLPGRPTCTKLGIDVLRVEDYCSAEVAEHAAMLALAVRHRLVQTALQIERQEWKRIPTTQISEAVIGIVGLGRIGMKSAARWRAEGHRVIGWSRSPKPAFSALGGEQRPLSYLMENADIILLHLPLAEGDSPTLNLIDKSMIARMRPSALLVNVARAGIVDREALANAIRSRAIFGAGIDVFEHEPPFTERTPCSRLLDLDPHEFNLVLTDHGAFNKTGPLERLAQKVIENARAWVDQHDRASGV